MIGLYQVVEELNMAILCCQQQAVGTSALHKHSTGAMSVYLQYRYLLTPSAPLVSSTILVILDYNYTHIGKVTSKLL